MLEERKNPHCMWDTKATSEEKMELASLVKPAKIPA